MNVGFIGTGVMGKPMARNILEGGYDLNVHTRTRGKAQELLEKGAKWLDTPEDVAKSCEVVLSCLPGPMEVEQVVYGPHGLMEGWKKGDIYVDMSTSSATTIRKIAKDAKAKGVEVLDAPVSGGMRGAESGKLTIMVGGNEHSLKKIRNILDTMGGKIFHVGDVGCGSIAKIVNNLIVLACNCINGEGFVLGVKAGIDPGKLLEVVEASSGANRSLSTNLPKILANNFDPGFRIDLASKDVDLALDLAKEYNVSTPVGSAVGQRLLEAKAGGLGDKGTAALILTIEELAGVQVRS